jgi:hypothetical protein
VSNPTCHSNSVSCRTLRIAVRELSACLAFVRASFMRRLQAFRNIPAVYENFLIACLFS